MEPRAANSLVEPQAPESLVRRSLRQLRTTLGVFDAARSASSQLSQILQTSRERSRLKNLLVEYADLHDKRALFLEKNQTEPASTIEDQIKQKKEAIKALSGKHARYLYKMARLSEISSGSSRSLHSQLHMN